MTTRAKDELVDVLDKDKPINGQKYACLSFISPEDLIKRRELFMLEAFVKKWDMINSMRVFSQFMHFVAYKHSLDFNKLNDDLQEFLENEKDALTNTRFEDEYKNFIDANEDALTAEYLKANDFQTSVRGIKVRGTYPSMEEAELRCKMIRENDPNFDVYVAEVGCWVPFHPEAYKTGRVEYLEKELNQLMHEKNRNEETAKAHFEKRVLESKRSAIENNKALARKNNNVLTQTIDETGNLVSIKNRNTQEEILMAKGDAVTSDEVRSALFDGHDVPTKDGPRMHPPALGDFTAKSDQ